MIIICQVQNIHYHFDLKQKVSLDFLNYINNLKDTCDQHGHACLAML